MKELQAVRETLIKQHEQEVARTVKVRDGEIQRLRSALCALRDGSSDKVRTALAVEARDEARKLFDAERPAKDSARAADRKAQVGSGDRSERIRTYNFPQGRVTDHRINLTLYKLEEVMAGQALDEVIDALVTEHQAELLAAEGMA